MDIDNKIWNAVGDSVDIFVWSPVRSSVRSPVRSSVRDSFYARIWGSFHGSFHNSVFTPISVEDFVWKHLQTYDFKK